MFRIDNPTAVPTLPIVPTAGTPGFFTNGNPQTGLDPTHVDDWFLNMLQEEIYTVVTRAGLVPNKTDNTQLWQALRLLNPRQVLTGPTSFYVNGTTGNDSNDGLTAGTAWQTIQRACDYLVENVDFNFQTVTVNIASGTYAPFSLAANPIGCFSQSNLIFNGNVSNPATVIVVAPSAAWTNAIGIFGRALCTIQGMTVQGPGGTGPFTNGLAVNGANVSIKNMIFGSTPQGVHLLAIFGGMIQIQGPYTISGGAQNHYLAQDNGNITCGNLAGQNWPACPVTLTGSPAFAGAFAWCNNNSVLAAGTALTFSGAATGARFLVNYNSTITSGSRGLNLFPGGVAGTVDAATYGTYAA